MASSGYLRGKVVCVDCRDYGERSGVSSMRRMEDAWQTFKTKEFVMLGSHRGMAGAEKIARIAKGLGLTYPIYADAGLAKDGMDASGVSGVIYVVGPTGGVVYRGADERKALGFVASSIMEMRSPPSPRVWGCYIDFCIDVLPGRALVEIGELRKAYPMEAKEYDSAFSMLSESEDIRRVAKLEMLTRQAKDYDFRDKSAPRLSEEKVELAIKAFSDLKQSANAAVVQEAKNCIAELTWAAARLSGKKGSTDKRQQQTRREQ